MSMEIVYQRSGDYLFPVEKGALKEVQEALKGKKKEGISKNSRKNVQEEPTTAEAGAQDTLVTGEEAETQTGKYARMRENYLMENRDILYQALLISGELDAHLEETERAARKRMEELMEALLVKYPAPERADMAAWTAHRNSLTEMAEEIVLSETVYQV